MTWISTQQHLPDVDLTVLGLLPDLEVWPMWLETDDGPLWRFLDGDPVRACLMFAAIASWLSPAARRRSRTRRPTVFCSSEFTPETFTPPLRIGLQTHQ